MAKFIKKVLLFLVLIAFVDVVSGFGFKYLRSHAKGGDTYKNFYISEKCCDDILIFGSSRAVRHYDPQVIEDSLGLSCYNCGEPGCGVITSFARYKMIEVRHRPKIVLYEVTPDYDIYKTDDYSKYLGRVRQHSDNPVVRQLFLELGDPLERLRLLSNMYRNNSFILHNLSNNLRSWNYNKGYLPLHGVLEPNVQNVKETNKIQRIDSIKLSYLEQFICLSQCNGVKICFMVSPRCVDYKEANLKSKDFNPIIDLCYRYQVPFINHTYMEGISNNHSLFNDFVHLNESGAQVYTRAICAELRNL